LRQSPYPVLALLLLAALACQVQAPAGVLRSGATVAPSSPPAATPTPQPSPTRRPTVASPTATPGPQACQVTTGQPGGFLHLRTCAGVACPVLAWLPEGAPVELLPTPAAGQWHAIRAGELSGWAYSEFLECNP